MAKRGEIRTKITLQSTGGTGHRYVTEKNRRNNPDRLVIRRYDPVLRQHVEYKETR